jgi:hypothetical protein
MQLSTETKQDGIYCYDRKRLVAVIRYKLDRERGETQWLVEPTYLPSGCRLDFYTLTAAEFYVCAVAAEERHLKGE